MKKSKLFTIDLHDVAKSFITAFMGAAAMALYKVLELGSFPSGWDQWKQILIAGLTAAVGYLVKNTLTNSNDEFGKPEPK